MDGNQIRLELPWFFTCRAVESMNFEIRMRRGMELLPLSHEKPKLKSAFNLIWSGCPVRPLLPKEVKTRGPGGSRPPKSKTQRPKPGAKAGSKAKAKAKAKAQAEPAEIKEAEEPKASKRAKK